MPTKSSSPETALAPPSLEPKAREARLRRELEEGASTPLQRAQDTATQNAIYYLTVAERQFVCNLATGMSQVDAAKLAGYQGNDSSIRSAASRMLARPIVRAALYEQVSAAFGKANIETEQTLRELASIAFMPSHMLEGKPKYSDKLRALELLARYQRMLDTHVHHDGEVGVVGLIVNSAKRDRERIANLTAADIMDVKAQIAEGELEEAPALERPSETG